MSSNTEPSGTETKRDLWDYAEILSRPIAVVLSGFIIAGIGYFGQRTLTLLSEQEQDSRFRHRADGEVGGIGERAEKGHVLGRTQGVLRCR